MHQNHAKANKQHCGMPRGRASKYDAQTPYIVRCQTSGAGPSST